MQREARDRNVEQPPQLVSRLKQASISREGINAMLDLHPRRTRIFDKAPLLEPSLVLNHKRAFEIDALASA